MSFVPLWLSLVGLSEADSNTVAVATTLPAQPVGVQAAEGSRGDAQDGFWGLGMDTSPSRPDGPFDSPGPIETPDLSPPTSFPDPGSPSPSDPNLAPPASESPPDMPAPVKGKGGNKNAELRLTLDTAAKLRVRAQLGYSEPVSRRLKGRALNNLNAGGAIDFELGSVDPRTAFLGIERPGLAALVPWSLGWTLSFGHDPTPKRPFSSQPLSGSFRLSMGVSEMVYAAATKAGAPLERQREWAFPINGELKVQWAPFAYTLPLLMSSKQYKQSWLTPLYAFIVQPSISAAYGMDTPRKAVQWCKKTDSEIDPSPTGSGKTVPLQSCSGVFVGDPTASARVGGTFWAGFLDPSKGMWRVLVGPSFSYSRNNFDRSDLGSLRLSLAMSNRLDLSSFVGGGSSPIRTIVELKPSVIGVSKEVGHLDDYGFMMEMTLYFQHRKVGKVVAGEP